MNKQRGIFNVYTEPVVANVFDPFITFIAGCDSHPRVRNG